jgi:hypothetical protein
LSTSYYALFHALARDAADLLVGTGAIRGSRAWTQAYRSLDHGFARNACREARAAGFPPSILRCAEMFQLLQEARHAADYDPNNRLTRTEALNWATAAEEAIRHLHSASRPDRRAFAVHILIRWRP